ncbi:hypothetical protein IFM89_008230 [Coptis chinensis]|uniref:Pentatricopeptide repeat-containing protein n=1 Tax=Coptis chinensis TaxID=261450 RepID=A0A835I6G8_9MAGN|nr:hypothetical protein IFM89_008230 [Coptis chinensis]
MIDKAISVFNEADPLVRNTHLCNTFLDFLLKAGRGVDGRKVLDEMLVKGSTFPPNDLTGFMFFDGLARRGKFVLPVKWEEVIGLVTKFGEHGVFPDALVLHKLITRLGRSGNVEHAWDLVHVLMKMSAPLEASCFNALLTGLGLESQFEKMNLLVSEMKEKGIKPDGITFGIRILYLCKSRRLGQAMEVLESMKKEKENGGASVVPDLIAYNTVIKGLCQVGRQEEGLVLVDKMISEHGYAANTITYNCLLDGFCKAGEIDRLRELFDQMNTEGVPADVITLNILVDGMCKHGRISSAFEFFNDMQKKGLNANAITYTSLISAFCNVNNLDKATAMFDLMVSSGCIPDKVVYYSLINGFSRAGRLDDACSVASKMKSKGFFLDA